MIWLRRIFTIPCGVLLLAFLLVTIALSQINSTLLTSEFYPRLLRDSDIYNFVLQDASSTFLNEARQISPDGFTSQLNENPLFASGLETEELVDALNRAFPAKWVQNIVEQSIIEPADYILGTRDTFTVTIEPGDRVIPVIEELKGISRNINAYEWFFDQVVDPNIDSALQAELPFGIELTSERINQSVRRIVPIEWMEANFDGAVTEITPFVTGDTNTFKIHIALKDRIKITLEEIKGILREVDAYDLVYEGTIAPIIAKNLNSEIQMPSNVSFSDAEITNALRSVATPYWVETQSEIIIDLIGQYFTGETTDLDIIIDLRENKANTRQVFVESAREKLDLIILELPYCAQHEIKAAVIMNRSTLPTCMPVAQETIDDQLRQAISKTFDTIHLEIEESVDQELMPKIPDNVIFTDKDISNYLESVGASSNSELLKDIRRIATQGWSYSDTDFRKHILELGGEELLQLFNELRNVMVNGWVYTEQDLQAEIGTNDSKLLIRLDVGRMWLNRLKTWGNLIFIPVTVLLLMIGFLGGQNWMNRISWAAGYLSLSAASVWVLFSPVYNNVSVGFIERAKHEFLVNISLTDDFVQTKTAVANKAIEIGISIMDEVAFGIADKALIVLIISLIILSIGATSKKLINIVNGTTISENLKIKT